MKILNVAVLSFAFSLVGCGGGDDEVSGPTLCDLVQEDPFISSKTFVSIEEHECGAGRPMCPWTITFYDTGAYEWTYSDTSSAGAYSCDGLDIDRDGGGGGTYDPDTRTVTWGGIVYQ
jgi:hypothetical protein